MVFDRRHRRASHGHLAIAADCVVLAREVEHDAAMHQRCALRAVECGDLVEAAACVDRADADLKRARELHELAANHRRLSSAVGVAEPLTVGA